MLNDNSTRGDSQLKSDSSACCDPGLASDVDCGLPRYSSGRLDLFGGPHVSAELQDLFIAQRIQGLVALLYLVENDEVRILVNLGPGVQFEISDDPFRLQMSSKSEPKWASCSKLK